MPVFFFDVDCHLGSTKNEVGSHLVDIQDVRREALGSLAELARDLCRSNAERIIKTTVKDERGNMVYRATMRLDEELIGS